MVVEEPTEDPTQTLLWFFHLPLPLRAHTDIFSIPYELCLHLKRNLDTKLQMGRYMRKAKTAGEVAIMDLTLGVRTRARTLALQKSSIPPSRSPSTASSAAAGGSYLQLRSRRLEKPPIVVNDSAKRAKQGPAKEKENCASESQNQNPNSSNSRARVRVSQADPGSNGSGQKNESNSNGNENVGVGVEEETNQDLGVEASFGENALEIEGRERWVSF